MHCAMISRPSSRRHAAPNASKRGQDPLRPCKTAIIGEIDYALRKMSESENAYIELVHQLCAGSGSVRNILKDICATLDMFQKDSKTDRRARKRARLLNAYLLPFTKKCKRAGKKQLVLHCPLFDKRPFQYGPACFVAKQTQKRCLAYFPLGSGKTLAALHAARTFLELHPNGRILVITTLANVHTTWRDNQTLYLQHVPDKHKQIERATVRNVDWWFSKHNSTVAHYNRLIQMLACDPTNRLRSLIQMGPKDLKRQVVQFQGRLPKKTKEQSRRLLCREWKAFKQHASKKSMLQATLPEGPFFLIVDECQEYINVSARSLLVQRLTAAAANTLFLSATPISDSETQRRGLETLLDRDVRRSVLWTNNTAGLASLKEHDVVKVHMTPTEWREHQIAASSAVEANAYLSKSRQTCNTLTKWQHMSTRMGEDCARLKKENGPVRIVVYSFFLKHGASGFLSFLKHKYKAQTKGRRIHYGIHGLNVQVSLMHDNTLQWFNDDSDTCKILILTSRSGTGISLKNVRVIHLMEPQWTEADEQQAIGRCTRKGSHDLVIKTVDVIRWTSLPPVTKTGRTADQKVHKRMCLKRKYTDAYLKKIQQAGKIHLCNLLEEFERNHTY